jgi:hypothetical protein
MPAEWLGGQQAAITDLYGFLTALPDMMVLAVAELDG